MGRPMGTGLRPPGLRQMGEPLGAGGDVNNITNNIVQGALGYGSAVLKNTLARTLYESPYNNAPDVRMYIPNGGTTYIGNLSQMDVRRPLQQVTPFAGDSAAGIGPVPPYLAEGDQLERFWCSMFYVNK